MEKLAIHENKQSERVVKFVTIEELQELTSKKYSKRILHALKNGYLHGMYFTKTGEIRATFI